MADTFQLEVATPERSYVDEQVTAAQVPAKNGYMGILPGHAPLLSALGSGVLTYEGGGGTHVVAVSGGFVEVFDDHVRVLADRADFPADIDVEAARRELDKALDAMRHAESVEASTAAAEAAGGAQARIDSAGMHRT